MREAIGMIELSSIGIGYQTQDAMLKAADVSLVLGRTICSGKFINVVTGAVSAVQSSMAAGLEIAPDSIIDHITIPNVHSSVFEAIGQSVQLPEERPGAVGIIETYSAASIIAASDAAAKAAGIILYRLHLAMALGGKGFCLMTGSVSSCHAGVRAGSEVAREKGLLVSAIVIPGPVDELYHDYL